MKQSRIHPSLKAAAASMKLPIGAIKWAKSQGCPAIRANGSVDNDEFMIWWADHGEKYTAKDKREEYKTKKSYEEWRKLKLHNDEVDNQLIEKALTSQAIHLIISRGTEILRQKLEVELPAECAGCDVDSIRAKNTKAVDAVRAQWREILKEW